MKAAPSYVVVGSAGSRPIEFFQQALARAGRAPAVVVAYEDLLAGQIRLQDVVQAGSIVRLESPGRNFLLERALITAGSGEPGLEGYAQIPAETAAELSFDRGRILYPRQWYLGYCKLLRLIEEQLMECPEHSPMNCPAEIAIMFDKRRCQERLRAGGIPVPRILGEVRSYNELQRRIRETGCHRLFLKLAHGSSASGALAYQANGRQEMAISTVEMVGGGGNLRLYNSRRVRTYRQSGEIAALVNALGKHCLHAEEWIPKAAVDGHNVDVRVVMIGGQVCHSVLRMSRTPFTNLHLLNKRGPVDALIERMGEKSWQAARQTCQKTMDCFPKSLYAGIDLLVASDYRSHAILEVNAFGDLLPGIEWRGMDTYSAEIEGVGR